MDDTKYLKAKLEVREHKLARANAALRDAYTLLQDVVDKLNKNDLSPVRKLPSCGAGMYIGRPAINVPFDKLMEKHEEAIYQAFKE